MIAQNPIPLAELLREEAEDARILGPEAEKRERFIIERERQIKHITRPERFAILSALA